MDHVSIGIYDYSNNKLCDLYDSSIQASGQAYNIVYETELNGWQQLTFNLPFVVDKQHNFRWDYIKSEYLVRMSIGSLTERLASDAFGEEIVISIPSATG